MALMSDSLLTSQVVISILPCMFGTISLTFAMPFSRAGREMSAIRIEAPSRANRMVVSRPIPLTEDVCQSHPLNEANVFSDSIRHRCVDLMIVYS